MEHTTSLAELTAALDGAAEVADTEPMWPAQSWDPLRAAGVLGWSISTEYGGQDRPVSELLDGYAQLAAGCLTTSFILSQREAAVRRIADSANAALCRELLRPLACGGRYATVGLSQLTTSRQHGAPALRAELHADRLLLDGTIPWVTGAAQADHVVIGAALSDRRQVLAVLPTTYPGVEVGPPLPLMALQGSLTAELRCQGVELDRRWLLAGPAEQVMGGGRGPGGLETSCLALGLGRAAIAHLEREAVHRSELRPTAERLEQTRGKLWAVLLALATGSATGQAAALRARANSLVLRATQAALTASKGAGFLRGHPAQRWVRQACFFLVWSCPRPAADATLAYLAGDEERSSCGWRS
ncbi:MAG: acyl-CoA/acyl-ACP dehydrogenase [Planctomycetia bacterium]|nr:acyl-CoA/acyl-ACP dehydrogenase [Planctomycetia bacterium]